MSERRFFAAKCLNRDGKPGEFVSSAEVLGKDFFHLKEVLRLEVGDRVQLICPETSLQVLGQIDTVSRDKAVVSLKPPFHKPKSYPILVAIPDNKGKSTTFMLEKSVELGARGVIVFSSKRSQGKRLEEKEDRFREVLKTACKQSGAFLPKLWLMPSFPQVIKYIELNKLKGLVLHPQATAAFAEKMKSISASLCDKNTQGSKESIQKTEGPVEYILVIGPEGGFTQEEIGEAEQAELELLKLNQNTLRSETALITALGALTIFLEPT